MRDVHVDPTGSQSDRRALNHHRLTRDLRLDDRQTLGQRMIRVPRGGLRPQQIGEVIACELLARF